jgi:peptidoglycan/xylan/chitin deacetylase (PgdA/CDA1 family)
MITHKNSGLITSWDDGHPLDLKVAEILSKYNIPGIFYIPITNPERGVMTKSQIRQLSSKFEIGGHTYSHADLISISLKDARNEIEHGKSELEGILGKKIDKFCYPKGKFNDEIKKLVKKAGFKEARTARIIFTGKNTDPFEENPNLHLYNHKRITYLAHCLKNGDFKTTLTVCKLQDYNFADIAKQLFVDGFHIWGHSWELEEKGLWKDLENFIRFTKNTSE